MRRHQTLTNLFHVIVGRFLFRPGVPDTHGSLVAIKALCVLLRLAVPSACCRGVAMVRIGSGQIPDAAGFDVADGL
jgi:hypothetical protein